MEQVETGYSGTIVGQTPWSVRVPLDPLFWNAMSFIESHQAGEGVSCGPDMGLASHPTIKLTQAQIETGACGGATSWAVGALGADGASALVILGSIETSTPLRGSTYIRYVEPFSSAL